MPCTEIVFSSSTISNILRSFYINAKCKMPAVPTLHTNAHPAQGNRNLKLPHKYKCENWVCKMGNSKEMCTKGGLKKRVLWEKAAERVWGWAKATIFPSIAAVLLLRGLSMASFLLYLRVVSTFCAPIAPKSISLLNDFSISLLTATFVATNFQKYAGLWISVHIYVFNGNRSPAEQLHCQVAAVNCRLEEVALLIFLLLWNALIFDKYFEEHGKLT